MTGLEIFGVVMASLVGICVLGIMIYLCCACIFINAINEKK